MAKKKKTTAVKKKAPKKSKFSNKIDKMVKGELKAAEDSF